MKAFSFFLGVALVITATFVCNQPKASTSVRGPTMLVITNDLQWAPTQTGPWETVTSTVAVVWIIQSSNAYYRALMHSSGFIPH
jgi:hypothetical protein